MKRKRISFMLASAPCSTRNLTISMELDLIAILRGHSLISKECNKTIINMKRKRISLNIDKYEMKQNFIKQ